jgi:hypothetical protein
MKEIIKKFDKEIINKLDQRTIKIMRRTELQFVLCNIYLVWYTKTIAPIARRRSA